MAEKKEGGDNKDKKPFDPEQRFRYVGFEVYQGKKIRDLFKSDAEKESWIKRVIARRSSGSSMRDNNQFEVPRVTGLEKIVLTITSLILIVSLFMPWFSGYTEYVVETEAPAVEEAAMVDSTMIDSLADSMGVMAVTEESEAVIADSVVAAATEDLAAVDEAETSETAGETASEEDEYLTSEKDERGFASISGVRKRKEIKRDHVSVSAFGALGILASDGGKIFSSGFSLMLTAILIIGYMLICILSAVYTLYLVYAGKKDPDQNALSIKKGLRLNWLPISFWAFGLLLSFAGAAYSFDTTDMIKQIGTSYGPATYLGLLSYGFYISMAAFIMNAVKAVEI